MGITVLSLFDGMSCGQIALQKLGVEVDTYYASEINKQSIEITMRNFPNTVQLGDITELTKEDLAGLGHIDLMIGGSPCQNLSRAVIENIGHNQGLEGDKSRLFYEYIRVGRLIQPSYYLLENVESMTKDNKEIINEVMGTKPIMINSNLVSAQDRKRYYWTNVPQVAPALVDKGEVIRDILDKDVPEKYFHTQDYEYLGSDKKIEATLNVKCHDMGKRVYNKNGKCGTLTACRGGYRQKKIIDGGRVRKLTPTEYERLQTVPVGYTEGSSDSARYNALGDGWTVDVISHIFSYFKNT